MKRIICVMLVGVCVAMAIAGCSSQQRQVPELVDDTVIIDEDATDQMFSEDVYGAEFFVFQMDGESFTVDDCYPVGLMQEDSLIDGRFYKVVADVTYLNGGIAGYVNFPEVHDVHSCVEVSADELDLPSIEETPYGLVRIGDYDVCPCIGQHVARTSQIEGFRITSTSYSDGSFRIVFRVG